jgi:hypothetical protein
MNSDELCLLSSSGALRSRAAALHGLRRYTEALEIYEECLVRHPWAQGVVSGIEGVRKALETARLTEAAKRFTSRGRSTSAWLSSVRRLRLWLRLIASDCG